jgi:ubiquinone/menaquinone biosynthesis C-methylase UbiE
LIRRTSINHINSVLKKNTQWKILDIGCGYTANKYATEIADSQDLSSFYKNKKFIKINHKVLPFKDNEFDFVIASHVIEHVEDFEFFIKELERISNKGYIELPTRLGDNLVFENLKDHIWWFVYNDKKNEIVASQKNQLIEPFLNVSTAKKLEQAFRESLVIELEWENTIEYIINDSIKNINFEKISFFKLVKKYFSKKIRMIFN